MSIVDMPAINRRSLHDEVVDFLRDMIVEGGLQPGEHLTEKQLCERLNVSRTPLREALKVLASEGLVELLPYRGAKVARLTEAEVDELFQVIGALEALSGELACRRIDAAGLAEIRTLHDRMVARHQGGDLPGYFRLNQQIHQAIMAAAGNATLARTHRELSGRLRRYRYQANLSPERWDAAVREHEELLEALGNRDPDALRDLLTQHLQNVCRATRKRVAEVNAGTA